jgi:ATP-binding cassette, subfamily B, bacterial CvaB/MchF/RaxB
MPNFMPDDSAAAGRFSFVGLLGGFSRTLPLILQTEAAECSLACMAMVAGYHGHEIDLPRLRARHAISMKGATLAQLLTLAGHLRLAARPLRVELEHLGELPCPCILHWDMNHFVVLKEVKGNTLVIHDPAVGLRRMPLSQASNHFTGIAVEFAPAAGFERKVEHRRLSIAQSLGRIVGLKRAAAQIVALALVLELCVLLAPYFMQAVVDHVALTADRSLLATLVVGFGLLLLIQHGIGALRSWAILYLGTTINLQWHGNVFAHLLRLPTSFFEKRHVGDVVSRFDSITTIQQTVTTSFVQALIDGLLAMATLAMMLLYAPWLAAISLATVALYAVLRVLSVRPTLAASQDEIVHAAKQQSHFLETIRGARAIKLFDKEADRRTGWLNLLVAQTNAHVRLQRLQIFFQEINGVLFGIERLAVIALAVVMVLERQFTVGALFAYIAYKDQFAMRITALIDKLIEFRALGLHVQRLGDIVTAEPEHDEGDEAYAQATPHASLDVKDLSFSYASDEAPVLDGLNLSIREGESVAIVGPSGCGKTTLLKLMVGILVPQRGDVRVGGVPIQRLGRRGWRAMVGTVMQDDQLLAGSIGENIAFFDRDADQQRVRECARLAAIADDIEQMPMGYNTLIGDMGAAISGGQKQRILLARALYKQPKILFLDEATSHLDVALERRVNEAISSLKITRVIVAHRPETIASADRVITLGLASADAPQDEAAPAL